MLFWALSQVMLLLFTGLYRLITKYDDHAQMKAANASAGLSSGLALLSLAAAMSQPLVTYASVALFVPIALAAAGLLVALRFLVDFVILPGDRLDGEILQQNWGAALIEGATAVALGFVLNLFVPKPSAGWDVCGE